jgi:hypothetical protein
VTIQLLGLLHFDMLRLLVLWIIHKDWACSC